MLQSLCLNIKACYFIPLLGTLSLLQSCVEEVTLDNIQLDEPQLVIEGRFTNEWKRHEVKITESNSFSPSESPVPVSGAQVQIEGADTILVLVEQAPGVYLTDSVAGLPNEAYTLVVNDGSKTYQATDIMPPIPADFEPAVFSVQGTFLDYEFRRHQFGFMEPNLWELHLIRDTIPFDVSQVDPSQLGQQIGVSVSEDLNYLFTYFTHPNIEVNGLLNFEIPHYYGFNPGFKVIQKKYSLSEAHYEFLRSLFMETEWRGTIFPSIPENIDGNISGGAFGFFGVISVKTKAFIPE